MTRAIVAFTCEHPWENKCNPRFCGGGAPHLRLVHSSGIGITQERKAKPERLKVATGPIVRAREPREGDPVPPAALALMRLAGKAGMKAAITYACGVLDPIAKRECATCHLEVRVTEDGNLYVHGPRKEACPDTTPSGPAIPAVIHSVLVRGGGHWAALWENGKAEGRWWNRRPVSDSELKTHLRENR